MRCPCWNSFDLAAGLTGAVESTGIIVIAGLVEIAAGSIAMGLGGYLAGKNDAEHYESEWARAWRCCSPSSSPSRR